jgi:aspartyl-tRNA(Asn)/glutamyl-tRNA(Gln) amidotransferase subunit A
VATREDLAYLPLVEAAAWIRAGEATSRQLTEAALERAHRLEPDLNAFVTIMDEEALADAEAADRRRAAGGELPPLLGVPVSLKDLYDTAGIRTTAGARIYRDRVSERDSTVAARLRAAGAVIFGKCNMLEFAYGEVHPDFGPSHNPWNLAHSTGGSSSGSGASVAAGVGQGTMGSDTGGSIRQPATWCGLVGLKPTYGRVSRAGVVPLSWSLDHCGPMTRTVADTAAMLAAVAGFDAADPASADRPVPDYLAALHGDLRGVRVLRLRDEAREATPAMEAATLSALAAMASAGASVSEMPWPDLDDGSVALMAILYAEASSFHEDWIRTRPGDYAPATRQRLEMGLRLPAIDYLRAQRVRSAVGRRYAELMTRFDLLVSPTSRVPAPPQHPAARETPPAAGDRLLGAIGWTGIFDLTGMPAVSVPSGFTAEGLPLGVQIAGRPFAEAEVLRAAAVVEASAGVVGRRPPVG